MSRKKFLAIVDPWAEPLEHDVEKFPHLESDTLIQFQLIHNQLTRLRPLFDDIIVVAGSMAPHPMFDELHNVITFHDPTTLDRERLVELGVLEVEYLSDKQDWDAWFCGFHYGRCLHAKINDIIRYYKWDYNRFHIIENLSFQFPEDEKRIWGEWLLEGQSEFYKNIKSYNWDYVSRFELNEK